MKEDTGPLGGSPHLAQPQGPPKPGWWPGARTAGLGGRAQPDMDGLMDTPQPDMDRHTHTQPRSDLSPPPPPLQEQAAFSAAGWGWPHTGPFVHHVPGHCPGVHSPVAVALGEEGAGARRPCGEVQLDAAVGSVGQASRHQGTSHCAAATAFISPPRVIGQQPQASTAPWGSCANTGLPRLLPAG